MSVSSEQSIRNSRRWRVCLVGLALCGIYCHLQSRGSLAEREQADWRKTADLHAEWQRAHQTLAEIAALEQRAAEARAGLDRWRHERGASPPMVWFPAWLRSQLRNCGIVEAQIRVNTERAEPGIVGLKRISWNVNLPPQKGMPNLATALLAMREMDQRERFVKVVDCSFRPGVEAPHWPAGEFNVETLIRE